MARAESDTLPSEACTRETGELALFRRYPDKGFVLEEAAVGYTLDDIAGRTDMAYTVADDVKLDAFGE